MQGIFGALGPHIKRLEFQDCCISDIWLAIAIQHCPNIEILKFNQCYVAKTNEPPKGFNLTKLKKLLLRQSLYDSIAQLLEGVTTLEEVSFEGFLPNYMSTQQNERLKTTLTQQKKFKKLSFAGSAFLEPPFAECQFQLEHLELNLLIVNGRQMEFVENFLSTQKSIKNCVFNVRETVGTNSYIPSMMRILSLRTLEKLRLVLYSDSAMKTICELDFCNQSITELKGNI